MATSKAMAEAKKRAAAYHDKRRAKKKKKATAKRKASQKKRVQLKAANKAAGVKPRAVEALFGEGAMGAKPRKHMTKTKRSVGY